MFIELTEILRCPRSHAASYMICVPITMDERRVLRGGVSCPVCGSDYPILDGIAFFSSPSEPVVRVDAAPAALTVEAARTFLGLDGPGGYVLLIGSAGRLALELSAALPGTQLVALNPPEGVASGAALSVLRSARVVPLKQPCMRGAVIGADSSSEPWLSEAAAVVLPGLRVVVEREDVAVPGLSELARGGGVLVAERAR